MFLNNLKHGRIFPRSYILIITISAFSGTVLAISANNVERVAKSLKSFSYRIGAEEVSVAYGYLTLRIIDSDSSDSDDCFKSVGCDSIKRDADDIEIKLLDERIYKSDGSELRVRDSVKVDFLSLPEPEVKYDESTVPNIYKICWTFSEDLVKRSFKELTGGYSEKKYTDHICFVQPNKFKRLRELKQALEELAAEYDGTAETDGIDRTIPRG